MKIALLLQGRQYAELRRLLDVRSELDKYPKVKSRLAHFFRRFERRRINPGFFCSELIASVYEQLKVTLFIENTTPAVVSPSMLADSRICHLRPLDGLMSPPDPSARDVPELLDFVQRQGSLPMNNRHHTVQLTTDAARVMKKAEILSEALDRVTQILANAGTRGSRT